MRSSPRVPDKTLESAQESLDAANPHATGFALPGRHGHRSHGRRPREADGPQRRRRTCRPPTPTATVAKPWVALGAHYDHLGHGDSGNSLAGKDEAGQDPLRRGRQRVGIGGRARRRRGARGASRGTGTSCSASGRAKSWACSARPRLSRRPPVPLDQLAAYLNFDMVGRMQDNKLTIQAAGTSPAWGRIIEQANVARRLRPAAPGGSVSADRRRELQRGQRAVPGVLHRRARRLPPADRHGRQDRLRGPRSRRRLRRGDPQPHRRGRGRRRSSPRSIR